MLSPGRRLAEPHKRSKVAARKHPKTGIIAVYGQEPPVPAQWCHDIGHTTPGPWCSRRRRKLNGNIADFGLTLVGRFCILRW